MNSIRGGMAWLALMIVLASSCATETTLVSTWELPGEKLTPYRKLVVIALMQDVKRSEAFELAAVQQLRQNGIVAIPGFRVLGGHNDLSRREMQSRIEAVGADGVLLFKVIAVDEHGNYLPPSSYTTTGASHAFWWDDPYWGYYHPYPYHYWGYWYPAVHVTTNPGYWVRSKAYSIETTLFRTSDNRLIWSAVSKTYVPGSHQGHGSALSHQIVARLEENGVLG